MGLLETILEYKKEEVRRKKRVILRSRLEDSPKYDYPRVSLCEMLVGNHFSIVAEVKKPAVRSSDTGEYDPLSLARLYITGGAKALVVPTDAKFFRGQLDDIERIRNFVAVPILQKDFIIDPYQLYEARSVGADAVYLLSAALSAPQLRDLLAECAEVGLEAVVGIHSEEEIDRLDQDQVQVIAIDNVHPDDAVSDIGTSLRLRRLISASVPVLSEGGIGSVSDVRQLKDHGIQGVVMGESFFGNDNPGNALVNLIQQMHGTS